MKRDDLERLNSLSASELEKLGKAKNEPDERPQFLGNRQQPTAPRPSNFNFSRSSAISKGGRSQFIDLSTNPFKQLTIFNVNISAGIFFQLWDNINDLWVEFDEIPICPCYPGVQIEIPDTVKKLSFRWGSTVVIGPAVSVTFFLSNGIAINTPPFNPLQVFHGAGYGFSGPQALITVEDSTNQNPALLVALSEAANVTAKISSIESPIPAGAIKWQRYITGLGGALGNVIFVPAIGQRVFVTDLSLADVPPTATTRAEYYFLATPPPAGVQWHQEMKAGAGSAEHNFQPPIEATPGDTFVVDIYQAGVAAPWWICARGYTV